MQQQINKCIGEIASIANLNPEAANSASRSLLPSFGHKAAFVVLCTLQLTLCLYTAFFISKRRGTIKDLYFDVKDVNESVGEAYYLINELNSRVARNSGKDQLEGGDMTREEYERSKEGKPVVSKKQLKKNKKRKYDAEEVAAVVRDPVPDVEETRPHEKSLEEREKEYNEKLNQEEVSIYNKYAKEQLEKGSFKPKTPVFQIRAAVSSGTYIRQLANDICEELGVSGHLVELRRTTQGNFGIENCFPLDVILNQPEEMWEEQMNDALRQGSKYVYTTPENLGELVMEDEHGRLVEEKPKMVETETAGESKKQKME